MTWRDEAKGLPVWPGALFYDGDDHFTSVCSSTGDGCVKSNGDEVHALAARCIPALDNPDTFAAFLRRLAIRLGCPEDVAAGGVLFYRRGVWTICAGPSDWETGVPEWVEESGGNGDDCLLAAVRAWKGVGVL